MDLKIHNTQGQLISQFDIETGLPIGALKKKILDLPCRRPSKLKAHNLTFYDNAGNELSTQVVFNKLYKKSWERYCARNNGIKLVIKNFNNFEFPVIVPKITTTPTIQQQQQLPVAKIPVGSYFVDIMDHEKRLIDLSLYG